VVNRGSETHPMHPHGHRVLVESRNGEPTTGSPLWLDTFDVQPGEVWQVLLRADNPGIWMAHCHNLEHATQGMVVHLTYEGVSTPYELGGGAADNRPE
jgi:FtsP/CotA-like multicopper oxidase with cupredoxin domain